MALDTATTQHHHHQPHPLHPLPAPTRPPNYPGRRMRKHIFLTGQPAVGKSTVISRVLEELQLPPGITAQGFFTEEVRSNNAGGGERTGFDVVTLDGKRGPLSRIGSTATKVRGVRKRRCAAAR